MQSFSCLTQETTSMQHNGNHENAGTTQKLLFLSFLSPIDWREGWWIATVLVRRNGTDAIINIFRQLIQNEQSLPEQTPLRGPCARLMVQLWDCGRPSFTVCHQIGDYLWNSSTALCWQPKSLYEGCAIIDYDMPSTYIKKFYTK